MVQFLANGEIPGDYAAVGAGANNTALGLVGAKGDFIHTLTVATTATSGTVVLKDGSTTVLSIAATTIPTPYTLILDAYSISGAWNITTGATVSVFCVGKFT